MEKTDPPISTTDPITVHAPSTHTGPGFDRWWLLVAAVILLIILLIVFIPNPYLRVLRFAQDGIITTIYVTLASFALVLVGGLVGALGRLSRNWLLKGITSLYVEVVRGVPILVQLIFWYYAMPSLIRDLGRTWDIPVMASYRTEPIFMAVLGLAFGYSAYMTEVYRAGIQSIPKGQMEAARSLGMSYFQAMRYVILPQAVRVVLPPVGNEFITLLKDSSLVSVVAVADLTRRGREFMAANAIPVQTWLMIALIYLVMTLLSARLVSYIERKTHLE